MNLLWLLVVIILIFAVLGAPNVGPWGNHSYGYFPSGIGLLIVIVLVILLLR
jgi:hypothetical protein